MRIPRAEFTRLSERKPDVAPDEEMVSY